MKQVFYQITENTPLLPGLYRLCLQGDCSAISRPGQFVNLKIEGRYLRRPISVCDWQGDTLTLLYKVVGEGTKALSALQPGAVLDTLTGLGNGFDTSLSGSRPLLIGGGIGSAPLYALAVRLRAEGKHPLAVLGFNTAAEIFMESEFRALIPDLIYTTVDGSRGLPGFVTTASAEVKTGTVREPRGTGTVRFSPVPRETGEKGTVPVPRGNTTPKSPVPFSPEPVSLTYTHFYACGPEPMLRAVYKAFPGDGQFSFEERMGCGFGACMGCTCETIAGPKRICRDGPVLRKGDLLWDA